MVVKNCRECEHTNNCRSYYSGLGCKKRDEILKPCVVAGKNTDNAMHDYFEKYK